MESNQSKHSSGLGKSFPNAPIILAPTHNFSRSWREPSASISPVNLLLLIFLRTSEHNGRLIQKGKSKMKRKKERSTIYVYLNWPPKRVTFDSIQCSRTYSSLSCVRLPRASIVPINMLPPTSLCAERVHCWKSKRQRSYQAKGGNLHTSRRTTPFR